jgi:hypothetical protein
VATNFTDLKNNFEINFLAFFSWLAFFFATFSACFWDCFNTAVVFGIFLIRVRHGGIVEFYGNELSPNFQP